MIKQKQSWQRFRKTTQLLDWTLKLLWQAHPKATVGIVIPTLFQALIPLGQLWVTKLLIDQIVYIISLPPSQRLGEPVQLALFYVALEAGLLLLGLIIGISAAHIRNILQEHLVYQVNLKVLAQAAQLDLAMYESPAYYDRLRRTQQQMRNGPVELLSALLSLTQTVVSLVSVGILVLSYRAWILPLLILTTIPSFAAMMYYGRRRFVLFDSRTPDGRRADYLSQLLSTDTYAKEIRVWGITDYLMELIKSLNGRFKKENIRLSRSQSIASIGGELLATIGYYLAYLFLVLETIAGRLTLGDLTLFAGAFSRTQSLFEELLGAITKTYEILLFAEYLYSFLHLEIDIKAPRQLTPIPNRQKGLTFKNFSFSYPGTERIVLKKINFAIPSGKTAAIIGLNGSGKTTLIKCLLRLYDPTEGAILIDGRDLRLFDPETWRKQIAIVFQDYARYHLTARENIGFGQIELLDNLEQIRAAAGKVGIDTILQKLPTEYETILGRRFETGCELSIGQWQRIAVARALLRDAPLLILDEPTASMDAQAEYELFQQFVSLAAGRTTLLISHRFSTVRMADHILVLKNGELCEEGNHDELLAKNGHYAYLFQLQAEGYQPDKRYWTGSDTARGNGLHQSGHATY